MSRTFRRCCETSRSRAAAPNGTGSVRRGCWMTALLPGVVGHPMPCTQDFRQALPARAIELGRHRVAVRVERCPRGVNRSGVRGEPIPCRMESVSLPIERVRLPMERVRLHMERVSFHMERVPLHMQPVQLHMELVRLQVQFTGLRIELIPLRQQSIRCTLQSTSEEAPLTPPWIQFNPAGVQEGSNDSLCARDPVP